MRVGVVLCLLLVSLVCLSRQQSMMRNFNSLARRRAGQAYRLFRKIRDPVKYKLQYAPTNLKRLLHGYYPKKRKGTVTNQVYHVHHHHYPKKKPLFVLPKPLFKLPKLPSFPKPKLPKINLPEIKLPKIKVSIEDPEELSSNYGPPSSEYGEPSSAYGLPTYGLPPQNDIQYEAPPTGYTKPTINADYGEYGSPAASIIEDDDLALETSDPADKLSDFEFDPLGSEVFNIDDVSKYFLNDDKSVQIIDISPDTIDIEIVKDDLNNNDDIALAGAVVGNSYTSYANPSTSYSYASSPSSAVGEFSYIPPFAHGGDLEDSLASASTLNSVISVPPGKSQPAVSPHEPDSDFQNTFFDNLRKHTSSFSDFDLGKTWETFSNWGGKI